MSTRPRRNHLFSMHCMDLITPTYMKLSGTISTLVLLLVGLAGCASPEAPPLTKPNVILIITDDQGYNDIAAHGNGMIETPHLDTLHAESIRLTNFHVDPTCSPTRSALMTGRYSTRTGVWHTIMGRSLMAPEEVTLAEVFKANGYRTGMMGKWHLGDNYPTRPQDQGFDEVVWHKAGGVGQGADYWGNDYFDDTYWRGEEPEPFTGYCTDVWFDEATAFIERNQDAPFFLYLATNAPHGPFLVDESYSQPYTDQGVTEPMDRFYGMITNIDENVGRLRAQLDALGLSENTMLIFMSDNGTAAGEEKEVEAGQWQGFSAGMRGKKGSEYEGGHRVPFFVHWPAGNLTGGTDVDQLAAHIDVLPTLADLLDLSVPHTKPLDGTSLKETMMGDQNALRDRTLLVHSQRIEYPEKWRKSAVMTDQWRLVNQHELYDIKADPGQLNDVASEHPDIVASLQSAYEDWWTSLSSEFDGYVRLRLGAAENPTTLMSHDWHSHDGPVPWHQRHVQDNLIANGYWAVDVAEAGQYSVTLLRWPRHTNQPMGVTRARLSVGDFNETVVLAETDTEATFDLNLEAGPTRLQSWLTAPSGDEFGAYFVEVVKNDDTSE